MPTPREPGPGHLEAIQVADRWHLWHNLAELPKLWACDVVATYLALRLEDAERHTGVALINPALPLLPPVAWHERSDPGAEQLASCLNAFQSFPSFPL